MMALSQVKAAALFILFNACLVVVLYIQANFYKEVVEHEENILKQQQKLYKNYIKNIRVISGQSECNSKEQTVFGEIPEKMSGYQLDMLAVEDASGSPAVFKICYEVYNFYNYANLASKQSLDSKEKQICSYKGIEFKLQQSDAFNTNCPVSDFFFSTLGQVEGYEKVPIKEVSALNLFVRRSNPDLTPIVGIRYTLKDRTSNLLSMLLHNNYSLRDICSLDAFSYKHICEIEEDLEVTLNKEHQISLDSQCSQGLLSFDSCNLYSDSILFNVVFFLGGVLLFITFLFLSFYMLTAPNNKSGVSILFQILFAIHLFCYYPLYLDNAYIKETIQKNCYLEQNPLQNIYDKASKFNAFYILYILLTIAFVFSPYGVKCIDNYQKKQEEKKQFVYSLRMVEGCAAA